MKFIFAIAVSCTLAGTAFASTAPGHVKKQSVVTNQTGIEVAAGNRSGGTTFRNSNGNAPSQPRGKAFVS